MKTNHTASLRSKMNELEGLQQNLTQWANQQPTTLIVDITAHFLLSQRSHHTRMAYARDVIEFLHFCEEGNFQVQNVDEISEKMLLLWKENLTQKHSRFDQSKRRIAQASVARKLCTLSALLDFALKRKLIEENPIKWVKRPKVRRQSHATVLSEDEILIILTFAKKLRDSELINQSQKTLKSNHTRKIFDAETQWCAIILLFSVGMRVSELCQLRMNDVVRDGDHLRLRFIAKGGRKHQPLIHPEASVILDRFIQLYRTEAHKDEPLFVTYKSKNSQIAALHRSRVFRMVRNLARGAGIQRAFSPHGCRATLATQLHKSGVPLTEIQTLLNHAQVTTTQLYIHRIDDLKEAAALQIPWNQISS